MVSDELDEKIIIEMFDYSRHAVKVTGWPYVSFLIKENVIVARDMNTVRLERDPSLECAVSAIRRLQASLEQNDLSEYTLFSLFEPTILSFEIALWANISNFIWCIDATSAPSHYFFTYTPKVYAEKIGGINVTSGVMQKEALRLVNELETEGDHVNIKL